MRAPSRGKVRSISSTTPLTARANDPRPCHGANPDLFLAPGQFARLRVAVAPPAPVLLLPDAAVLLEQSQHLVMTVSATAASSPRSFKPAISAQPAGYSLRLQPSDRVVIDGLVRAARHEGRAPDG